MKVEHKVWVQKGGTRVMRLVLVHHLTFFLLTIVAFDHCAIYMLVIQIAHQVKSK